MEILTIGLRQIRKLEPVALITLQKSTNQLPAMPLTLPANGRCMTLHPILFPSLRPHIVLSILSSHRLCYRRRPCHLLHPCLHLPPPQHPLHLPPRKTKQSRKREQGEEAKKTKPRRTPEGVEDEGWRSRSNKRCWPSGAEKQAVGLR